jgi:hypothetical protein
MFVGGWGCTGVGGGVCFAVMDLNKDGTMDVIALRTEPENEVLVKSVRCPRWANTSVIENAHPSPNDKINGFSGGLMDMDCVEVSAQSALCDTVDISLEI